MRLSNAEWQKIAMTLALLLFAAWLIWQFAIKPEI